MDQLEVVADGRRYLFNPGVTVVCGRSAEANVPLIDRRVGRTHARLSAGADGWYLDDAQSTNGTWIEGDRIQRRRIEGEVTVYLGNPTTGTLLYLRLHAIPEQSDTVLVGPGAPDMAADPIAPGQPDAAAVAPGEFDAAPGQPDAAAVAPGEFDAAPAAPIYPEVTPAAPDHLDMATAVLRPPDAPPTPLNYPGLPPAGTLPPANPYAPAGANPAAGVSQPPAGPFPPSAPTPAWGPPQGLTAQPTGVFTSPPPPGFFTGPAPAAPVLVVRLGTRTLIFNLGQPVRVGREPGLEAVTDHPLVSRNYHGLITTDGGGATYTDSSSRGTFHRGRQLTAPLRITEPVTLRLGDPATGEELGITPPLSLDRLQANRRRRERSVRLRVVAAVVAAVLVVGGAAVAVVATRHHPTPAPVAALSAAALHHAETATVRLLVGTVSNNTGWGSGTIISPDGLILTNAHVAAPSTPGAAVATAAPGESLDPNPAFVTVEFTSGDASAVQARYRAHTVAVDGYLDLAVVRIFATDSGAPVDASTLNLPYLKIGDVKALTLDQNISILGYPGVSGSDSITVTSGVVSTFIPDPLKHVNDPRFQLETTARVAHGNSGGAAITDDGELVGVPSLSIPGEGSDLSWRLRSVAEAAPLIAAARAGTGYRSTLLVGLTGDEHVTRTGIGAAPEAACAGTTHVAAGPRAVIAFQFTGMPTGLDIAFLIVPPDGTPVTTDALQDQSIPGLPELTLTSASGCLTYELTADEFNQEQMPSGPYHVQLLGGPNLDPLTPGATVTID